MYRIANASSPGPFQKKGLGRGYGSPHKAMAMEAAEYPVGLREVKLSAEFDDIRLGTHDARVRGLCTWWLRVCPRAIYNRGPSFYL